MQLNKVETGSWILPRDRQTPGHVSEKGGQFSCQDTVNINTGQPSEQLNLIQKPQGTPKKKLFSSDSKFTKFVVGLTTLFSLGGVIGPAASAMAGTHQSPAGSGEVQQEKILDTHSESTITQAVVQKGDVLPDSDYITATPGKTLFEEPLTLGMKGEKVEKFKEALSHFVEIEVNDRFDEQTVEAVKAYQAANNLAQDGVAGDITYGNMWASLFWEKGIAHDLNSPDHYITMPENISISVDRGKHRAYIHDAQTKEIVKEYPISAGAPGHASRTGSFKITEISPRPTWYPPSSAWAKNYSVTRPGPNNPLGPVKMRLDHTPILFHGVPTKSFNTLGRANASKGCFRMFPQHAWELHNIIKSGTPVTVR